MIINNITNTISYENSYEFGYNNIPFSFRDSEDDVYFIRYGALKREPLNWRDECIYTARLIYDTVNEPINVFFGGGMDSAVMAESFRLANVPFNIFTIRFGDNWNYHDIQFAIKWCEAYGVKQNFLNLNLEKFWESGEFLDYGLVSNAYTPQFLPLMWAIKQTDGFPVIGNGEADIERNKTGTGEIMPYDKEGELMRAWDRYLISQNRNGAPSFFKYTPEMKVCQYLDDDIIKWANQPNNSQGRILADYKNELYRLYFPNLSIRPPITSRFGKNYTFYNGFERVPDHVASLEDEARVELEKLFSGHNTSVITEFNDKVKTLLEGYPNLWQSFINKRETGHRLDEKLNSL